MSTPKRRTFVEELETPLKPEKPAVGSKRFTWSAPIVSAAVGKKQDFSNVTKQAPRPKATGTLAPASETLAADRRMIAQARKAKKVRS